MICCVNAACGSGGATKYTKGHKKYREVADFMELDFLIRVILCDFVAKIIAEGN